MRKREIGYTNWGMGIIEREERTDIERIEDRKRKL